MNWRQNLSRSKEVLGAYFRQGLHELGSVFYGPGTAAQHAEYGMAGTRTPGEIADGIRGIIDPGVGKHEPGQNPVDVYLAKAQERQAETREPERKEPSMERE